MSTVKKCFPCDLKHQTIRTLQKENARLNEELIDKQTVLSTALKKIREKLKEKVTMQDKINKVTLDSEFKKRAIKYWRSMAIRFMDKESEK